MPKDRKKRYVEIMDTTLRDGEQTQGVSMAPEEKLTLARLLLERVKVDRIEVANARVSEGEHKAVSQITEWAESQGLRDRIECLGFIDARLSVDWLHSAGCRTLNLLTKGSLRHLQVQLDWTPEENVRRIQETYEYARSKGFQVNIYLEDWSQGMMDSKSYVFDLMSELDRMNPDRIMLPDTLGVSSSGEIAAFFQEVIERFPDRHFDFHGHNDYGMATANSLAAVQAGAKGVHCTVNGLGERAGNAPLDEVCAALRDFGGVRIRVREKELRPVSHIVEIYSGQRIAPNKPICGDKVFTQTAGIHADGDKKGRLYETRLSPDRFGRSRSYALGKLSGKANLEFNLRRLGIELKPEQFRRVLERIVELGDLKKSPTTEDLPFIIADVLRVPETRVFEIMHYAVVSSKGLQPCATVKIRYQDQEYEVAGVGDGGYDAFMNALRSIEEHFERPMPRLVDYEVRIPPGGRTSALVETSITWENGLQTRGVSSDQVMAAIEATETMMNIIQQPGSKPGVEKKRRRSGGRKNG